MNAIRQQNEVFIKDGRRLNFDLVAQFIREAKASLLLPSPFSYFTCTSLL
jgi:hypothetical protein